MSYDIWHQTATALDKEVDEALWRLRESDNFKAMGSEIERAFAASFVLGMRVHGMRHTIGGTPLADGKACFFLTPQYEIGSCRADFVLGWSGSPNLKDCVVIECDGHEWHEKTKEQAARDKARDRYLSRMAGKVIHFTGSEIYRDAALCWREALRTLNALRDIEDGGEE